MSTPLRLDESLALTRYPRVRRKSNQAEGITVYQRRRKWWFRLTTGRNILTDEPKYEYSGGFAGATLEDLAVQDVAWREGRVNRLG